MLFENIGLALKQTIASPLGCLEISTHIVQKTPAVYKHKSCDVLQTQKFPGTVI